MISEEVMLMKSMYAGNNTWNICRTTPYNEDERFGLFVEEVLVKDGFFARFHADAYAYSIGMANTAAEGEKHDKS